MGFILSKIRTPPDYDEPNPATGITPRQKEIVQSVWKIVREDTKNNGIKIFIRFFELYPEYQKIFPAFADVPKSELAENKKLLAHVMSVMYALNSVVDNMDDPDTLVTILQKVGTSHRPRNLNASHFKQLFSFLVAHLTETLGSSIMDDRAQEAWRVVFEAANGIIIPALEGTS